jgi:hypothetical protein
MNGVFKFSNGKTFEGKFYLGVPNDAPHGTFYKDGTITTG